jgi:hypothetical protein
VLLLVMRWCRGHDVMEELLTGLDKVTAAEIVTTPAGRKCFKAMVEKSEECKSTWAELDAGTKRDLAMEALNIFFSQTFLSSTTRRLSPEARFWEDVCNRLGRRWACTMDHPLSEVRIDFGHFKAELRCKKCTEERLHVEFTHRVTNALVCEPSLVFELIHREFVRNHLSANANTILRPLSVSVERNHLQRSYTRVFAEQFNELHAIPAESESPLHEVFVDYVKSLHADGTALKQLIDAKNALCCQEPLHVPLSKAPLGFNDSSSSLDELDDWV